MPAKPKEPVKQPKLVVQSAGKQEDFVADAIALAEALGWKGDGTPESESWEQYGIEVKDAKAYIAKTLHEHFQAGAKGEDQPSYEAACVHLGVDNATEQSAIDDALAKAYEAGKGANVTEHAVKPGLMKADLEGNASALVGGG